MQCGSTILALWISKKAFNGVLREYVRWTMCKLGVEQWLVLAVMTMYTGAKTVVRTVYGNTHTQPFYGSVEFVRENPGEPVPEETFTHYSHRSHQSSLSAFSI